MSLETKGFCSYVHDIRIELHRPRKLANGDATAGGRSESGKNGGESSDRDKREHVNR